MQRGQSDEALEPMQRGQSDETGLRTDPERVLHMQLKQIMSRISSLEKMSGVSGLNPTVSN